MSSENTKSDLTSTQDTNREIHGRVFDTIIVGGGPAGLSAAIYLGRMRRSVLLVDDHAGRSTWHQINRNYLGFVDGIHATALREIGERQAAEYGVQFLDARLEDVSEVCEAAHRLFACGTLRGEVRGKTIILATGVHDRFPEFDGSLDCIGKSMFWCTICDGYEAIGKRIVVLGHGTRAASLALELLVFTDKVTLVAWDEPLDIKPEKHRTLLEHGVKVVNSCCNLFTCSTGQLSSITLDDGSSLELDMLFVAQRIEPNSKLAKDLNVNLDEHGFVIVDSEQSTNVAGVFASGDVTRLFNHQVTSAVHEGGMAAASANYYLYEDWQKD